jgi:hypothetical protein
MTSADRPAGLTAWTLLFGGPTDDAGALRESPSWEKVEASLANLPSELPGMARNAVNGELATAIAGILDIDLGDVLIYGWRIHRRLVDAGRQTLEAPGRKEIVRLASHQITSVHHPAVDLDVDGARVHTFRFDLTVTFDVDVASAIVQHGKLVAVTSGDLTITGILAAEMPAGNVQLARQERRIDPHLLIRLGRGVPLVDPATDSGPNAVTRAPDQSAPHRHQMEQARSDRWWRRHRDRLDAPSMPVRGLGARGVRPSRGRSKQ